MQNSDDLQRYVFLGHFVLFTKNQPWFKFHTSVLPCLYQRYLNMSKVFVFKMQLKGKFNESQ